MGLRVREGERLMQRVTKRARERMNVRRAEREGEEESFLVRVELAASGAGCVRGGGVQLVLRSGQPDPSYPGRCSPFCIIAQLSLHPQAHDAIGTVLQVLSVQMLPGISSDLRPEALVGAPRHV